MANLYGYNTSTARKLESNDFRHAQNLHKELHKINRENISKPTRRPKQKAGFGSFVCVAIAFVMAFAIVGGYVAINEANNEISMLKAEYNDIVAGNQALQVKIDKAIDFNELQEIAGKKFGMARPERYQMFYIDLDMNDVSEDMVETTVPEKDEKVNVTGVPGIITGTLNIFN